MKAQGSGRAVFFKAQVDHWPQGLAFVGVLGHAVRALPRRLAARAGGADRPRRGIWPLLRHAFPPRQFAPAALGVALLKVHHAQATSLDGGAGHVAGGSAG